MKRTNVVFHFKKFSKKQLQVLTWWRYPETKDNDAIIADGSVRAGKTSVMSLSYIIWSMEEFNDQQFGIAGKTIGSLRRNVIRPLKKMLLGRKYQVIDHRTENMLEISKHGVTNYYFLFGGKDESSQDLVQGITAAGFFFDEVALMPESFVNQATSRVSVDGGKFWFNCNPAGPYHWFKLEWIDQLEAKRAVNLHFMMSDNPSLTQRTIERYKRMYSGVFYQRYIQGLWVMAEGVIYSNFDQETMVVDLPDGTKFDEQWVSIDYGTMNATAFKLWSLYKDTWYNTGEYYYSGRESQIQRTDSEYADDLEKFYEDNHLSKDTVRVILDPSAKSFKTELKQHGFNVKNAKNKVLDGIRGMMSAMSDGVMKWSSKSVNTLREIHSYIWDAKAADRGEDKPVKQNDHGLDADRYMYSTVIEPRNRHSQFWGK